MDTTTPVQSDPESIGNEGALYISQSYRTKAALSENKKISLCDWQLSIFQWIGNIGYVIGCVLWNINLVDSLMSKPVYTYILNMYEL